MNLAIGLGHLSINKFLKPIGRLRVQNKLIWGKSIHKTISQWPPTQSPTMNPHTTIAAEN